MQKTKIFGLIFVLFFALNILFIFSTYFNKNNLNFMELGHENLQLSNVKVVSPPDIVLSSLDSSNSTISWTLSEGDKDFLGQYSFTNDVLGSYPINWTISEPANSKVQVSENKDDHNLILNLSNYGGGPAATQIFGTRYPTDGHTIEFWVYGENGTQMFMDVEQTGPGSGNYIWLQFRFNEQKLYNVYNSGSSSDLLSSNLVEETWHHVRIQPTTSNSFRIWLNGVELGPVSGTMFIKTYYTRIFFNPQTAGNVYIDAVDYSWSSGYYLNRNMNYTNEAQNNLTYAVFEDDVQKTAWLTWNTQVEIEYNVSGAVLGVGNHNISLVFNDSLSLWRHDDVQVNVHEVNIPNILEVTQNPLEPSYQEPVDVTAHITDDTQIQSVIIEVNQTKDYAGIFSFTNDTVGGYPTGWDISEPLNSDVQVINEKADHGKVVKLTDTGNAPTITQIFGSKTPGDGSELEWWVYGEKGSTMYIDIEETGPMSGNYIWLQLRFDLNILYNVYNSGSNSQLLSSNLTEETWHHFRIRPTSSSSFQIWLNGVELGPIVGTMFSKSTYTRIYFTTQTACNVYVDAVDYSWASGYYTNRNMDYINLNNYSMSLLSGSAQDGVWGYTIANYSPNKMINYKIYASDIYGNLNMSSKFSFGYFDHQGPDIKNIISTPPIPTYPESVNITVQISDATPLNLVKIETNSTGIFENISMMLHCGSLTDGIWGHLINNYVANKSISFRIFATDSLGNSNITSYLNIKTTPIYYNYYLITNLTYTINLGHTRTGNITFEFKNVGTTTLINLNFTITLPDGWNVDLSTKSISELTPDEKISISFIITAHDSRKKFNESLEISFKAILFETGEEVSGSFKIFVIGIKEPGFIIWLIIIVGSVAAAAFPSYIFIKKRRRSLDEPLSKLKTKQLSSLKQSTLREFPNNYTVLSIELIEKINSIKGLSKDEKELLFQYITQLDEDEAKIWLEDLRNTVND